MRKSNLAQLVQKEVNRQIIATRKVQTQTCLDAAMIAANEVFSMGEGRCVAFATAFSEALTDIAEMTVDDTPDIEYTKTKLDRRLQQICGKHFEPWDKRYG